MNESQAAAERIARAYEENAHGVPRPAAGGNMALLDDLVHQIELITGVKPKVVKMSLGNYRSLWRELRSTQRYPEPLTDMPAEMTINATTATVRVVPDVPKPDRRADGDWFEFGVGQRTMFRLSAVTCLTLIGDEEAVMYLGGVSMKLGKDDLGRLLGRLGLDAK